MRNNSSKNLPVISLLKEKFINYNQPTYMNDGHVCIINKEFDNWYYVASFEIFTFPVNWVLYFVIN